jgi:hypothetical protein
MVFCAICGDEIASNGLIRLDSRKQVHYLKVASKYYPSFQDHLLKIAFM